MDVEAVDLGEDAVVAELVTNQDVRGGLVPDDLLPLGGNNQVLVPDSSVGSHVQPEIVGEVEVKVGGAVDSLLVEESDETQGCLAWSEVDIGQSVGGLDLGLEVREHLSGVDFLQRGVKFEAYLGVEVELGADNLWLDLDLNCSSVDLGVDLSLGSGRSGLLSESWVIFLGLGVEGLRA